MEKSRYLAALIGPVLLAIGTSILVNRAVLGALVETFARNYAIVMITGAIVLVAGLAIVASHRVWRGWPAIISVIGVLCVVGGATRLILPAVVADIASHVVVPVWAPFLAAAVLLVPGAILCFQAFFRKAPSP